MFSAAGDSLSELSDASEAGLPLMMQHCCLDCSRNPSSARICKNQKNFLTMLGTFLQTSEYNLH